MIQLEVIMSHPARSTVRAMRNRLVQYYATQVIVPATRHVRTLTRTGSVIHNYVGDTRRAGSTGPR